MIKKNFNKKVNFLKKKKRLKIYKKRIRKMKVINKTIKFQITTLHNFRNKQLRILKFNKLLKQYNKINHVQQKYHQI